LLVLIFVSCSAASTLEFYTLSLHDALPIFQSILSISRNNQGNFAAPNVGGYVQSLDSVRRFPRGRLRGRPAGADVGPRVRALERGVGGIPPAPRRRNRAPADIQPRAERPVRDRAGRDDLAAAGRLRPGFRSHAPSGAGLSDAALCEG